jgi:hypothetical protein
MEYIDIHVTVLRFSTFFKVTTEEKLGFDKFKENCKRACPIPVNEFLIIFQGNVLKKFEKEDWENLKKIRKVFMMVQSFLELSNEPLEFRREKKKMKMTKESVILRFSNNADLENFRSESGSINPPPEIMGILKLLARGQGFKLPDFDMPSFDDALYRD